MAKFIKALSPTAARIRSRLHIAPFSDWPTNSIACLMLCIAVFGAPFLFGSAEPATVAFWCFWCGLAMLLTSPASMRQPHNLLLGGILAISTGYSFVLHEQLAAAPWLAAPHPVWAEASAALGTMLLPSTSIARNAPFYNIGCFVANILILVLGLVIGTDVRLARRVIFVAACAGAVFAAYGILADLFTPGLVLWREKEFYYGDVTGTFTYRNTAAAYFGAMTLIWLLLLIEMLRNKMPRGKLRWTTVWQQAFLETRGETLSYFVPFFVCFAALLMTQSRGGVIFSLAAMLFATWLFCYRDLTERASGVVIITGGVVVSLVVLQILSGAVANRIETQGLTDAGRLEAYKATLRLIADYPWFGTGIGTFKWSFPAYRTEAASMWGVWEFAHSTPLQVASEIGLPLTALVAAGWSTAIFILARAVFIRRRDRIIPLCSLSISLLALAHSTIDFSMEIAGFSAVVFAVVGVGLAQSFRSPPNTDRGRKCRTSLPWEDRVG